VPELRGGGPVWLTGRAVGAAAPGPKYRCLPGPKPLLGAERVGAARAVVVVEGPFDLLTLVMWRLPGLALMGTHASAAALDALARFWRVYLALDADGAGMQAAAGLAARLGGRAVPVRVPPLDGAKDVADLATVAGGRAAFVRALLEAGGRPGRRSHARHRHGTGNPRRPCWGAGSPVIRGLPADRTPASPPRCGSGGTREARPHRTRLVPPRRAARQTGRVGPRTPARRRPRTAGSGRCRNRRHIPV
jgi:hypothetical protein